MKKEADHKLKPGKREVDHKLKLDKKQFAQKWFLVCRNKAFLKHVDHTIKQG